jgi:shikimate kinase
MGHIWLSGMMGVGKTTVGAIVAERLHRPLLDTDGIVMESTGRTIPELFEESERVFRAHERSAVVVAAGHGDAVIATGGGAVLDPPNAEVMRSTGTIVLLSASTDEIVRRVARHDEHRPLATDPERIGHLNAQRRARYEAVADHTVDTTDRTPAEVAEEVLACVGM